MAIWRTGKIKSVLFVGHGPGGALALLDAVSFRLRHGVSSLQILTATYGAPRVGNPAFIDEADTWLLNIHRFVNKRDPAPTFPERRHGFQHPHGEIHIDEDGTWYKCNGRENQDPRCHGGGVEVNDRLEDHVGLYNGISMICDPHILKGN